MLHAISDRVSRLGNIQLNVGGVGVRRGHPGSAWYHYGMHIAWPASSICLALHSATCSMLANLFLTSHASLGLCACYAWFIAVLQFLLCSPRTIPHDASRSLTQAGMELAAAAAAEVPRPHVAHLTPAPVGCATGRVLTRHPWPLCLMTQSHWVQQLPQPNTVRINSCGQVAVRQSQQARRSERVLQARSVPSRRS